MDQATQQANKPIELKMPEVITISVNGLGYNAIRQGLGSLPHDAVAPLVAEINEQVRVQTLAFNGRGPDGQLLGSQAGDPAPRAPVKRGGRVTR